MKELKKNDIEHSLIIEDFKRACRRIEHHESRILRIYILILTGFVIILGLTPNSEFLNIPRFIVPIILGIFIWINFNFGISDRRFKFFAMSYLLHTSKKYKGVNFDQYFYEFENDKNLNEVGLIKKAWIIIQKYLKPFTMIYIFGLFISGYIIIPVIKTWCEKGSYFYIIIYLIIIFSIHLLILGKLIVLYKNSFAFINNKVKSIHNRYSDMK